MLRYTFVGARVSICGCKGMSKYKVSTHEVQGSHPQSTRPAPTSAGCKRVVLRCNRRVLGHRLNAWVEAQDAWARVQETWARALGAWARVGVRASTHMWAGARTSELARKH